MVHRDDEIHNDFLCILGLSHPYLADLDEIAAKTNIAMTYKQQWELEKTAVKTKPSPEMMQIIRDVKQLTKPVGG